MNFDKVRDILCLDDGSLPDINFDFGQARVVGDAYALLQVRAASLASEHAYYWSVSKKAESPIRFGENPAQAFLGGEAEGFHVVFSGLRSTTGAPIPDLGVSVLDVGFIALDYRMGLEWDAPAILGLFEVMRDLSGLAKDLHISHTGNVFESDEGVLITEFKNWLATAEPGTSDEGPAR